MEMSDAWPKDVLSSPGGSTRKACDPPQVTLRSRLQHQRARIHQQINKEMLMRTGAENLFRATTNHKVRETVALELSIVNSNLQLLKEELEELNSNVGVYQTESSEAVNVPMIPLGLKETKELDFSLPLKDFICRHYGEEASQYEAEIKELNELRQAMRTPSRNEAGLELLIEYYNQLYFLEQRFFHPGNMLAVQFHWYDSLTGVPSSQRALAFEKGSVLFNVGALYTQIGTRQNRSSAQGIANAIDAFQCAAGAFSYLKENFSNAPSLDMSGASLGMLVRLMLAQVQECVFERVLLLVLEDGDFPSHLQVAQEAARVSDMYWLAVQTMQQAPVKDYVPFSWATLAQVKNEHFRALSHYYAGLALCSYAHSTEWDDGLGERMLQQLHSSKPSGPPLGMVLRDPEERRRLGKAHLRRAVIRHEEAMRIHGLCRVLRKMDILQEVLASVHKRSLSAYSQIDREDDFCQTAEAPDIHPKTQHKPDVKTPDFSKVRVTDLFQRLGPLSVFSARNQWCPQRRIRLVRSDSGLGLTLRGDSPVLVAGVVPGGNASEAGLCEGDYIVAVNGADCKWAKHVEVVQALKACSDGGVELGIVTMLSPKTLKQVQRSVFLSPCGIDESAVHLRNPTPSKGGSPTSLLTWTRKKGGAGGGVSKRLSSAFSLSFGAPRDAEAL
ncbi:rhophilin-1 isoform X2 [Paramormyrops kingsleyae]|uniref:rhophilin-1 isoform X2 n=1 Tax=Paramormyrops kingsleyae TaxID=1676925 RepID=UPI003B97B192